MLAQPEIDNWLQIVIAILVVGGSVIGAVSKKLIQAFSPKEPDKPGQTPAGVPGAGGPRRPAPAQGPGQPARPVARPMTRTSPRPPSVEPPVGRPYAPPPPVVIYTAPEESAQRPAPRPPTAPRPRPATPVPARAEQRLGHLEPAVLEEEARFEAATERRMAHLESAVPEEELHFDEDIEERLGHVESTPPVPAAAGRSRARVPVISRPSRQTLRRAVVLREILSPPLALRPPGDEF